MRKLRIFVGAFWRAKRAGKLALQSKTTEHDRSLHKELTMEIAALYVLLDELS